MQAGQLHERERWRLGLPSPAESRLTNLNRARLGAVLVEAMYMSHRTADRFLADSANLDAIALSLSQAVNTVLDAEIQRQSARGHSVFASLLGILVG